MRCREVRIRLAESARAEAKQSLEKELLEHLQQCPACAHQAQAAQDLRRAFADSRAHDYIDRLTWSQLKSRVEAQVVLTKQNQHKEIPLMSGLKNQLRRSPRLSLGIAASVVVLLAVTLIPFKFDQTVGFEVAVAGVDRDLAFDAERLNDLFVKLGVGEAAVDVTGCEETCNLMVSQLKSEGDAQLVAAAFDEMGKAFVTVDIKTVCEETSGSLLGQAKNVFVVRPTVFSDFELQQALEERIGNELAECRMMIIGETSEDGPVHIQIVGEGADLAEHNLTWVQASDGIMAEEIRKCGDGATGEKVMCIKKICDGDFSGCIIKQDQIVDGHLTEEARQALEAQGYVVEESQDADGAISIKLTRNTGEEEEVMMIKIMDDGEGVAKESSEAELPEGYQLSQNYPNPFNPTTSVDYSVDQAQHVTIEVFNINGQRVRTLVDEFVSAGEHTVEWDATSDSGERVASGVYLYRFTAGEVVETRKMTLLK